MDTEVAVSQVDYRSVHRDWSDRQSGETRGTLHQRSSSRLFFFLMGGHREQFRHRQGHPFFDGVDLS